jgi:predicted TPR repeat methyltransferase
MAYAQLNALPQALEAWLKALTYDPKVPELHNNLGNVYKALGQLTPALRHYQQALRLKSPYPNCHNNLGALYYQLGQIKTAIEHLEKALRMAPDAVEAHFNLANCHLSNNALQQACTHLYQVVQRAPQHLSALHNLGVSLTLLKDFERARPYLERANQLQPNNIEVLFHLALIDSAQGEIEIAIQKYQQLLSLAPNHAKAHHNLATLYLNTQQHRKAISHYQQTLSLNPANNTARHMLDALYGKTNPHGAPLDYVRALFNQYAYTYESHVKQLDYQIPAQLRALISNYCKINQAPWQALDLGCGTGLIAPFFTDLVGKLYGIDIAPNMLEIARQKNAYYKLQLIDIAQYLSETTINFDLIIAADTLNYFGELTDIFHACYQRLVTPGYFVFSIETLPLTQKNNFQLNPTGRYAHKITYIERLANELGFELATMQSAPIRTQEQQPVIGHLFLLSKK